MTQIFRNGALTVIRSNFIHHPRFHWLIPFWWCDAPARSSTTNWKIMRGSATPRHVVLQIFALGRSWLNYTLGEINCAMARLLHKTCTRTNCEHRRWTKNKESKREIRKTRIWKMYRWLRGKAKRNEISAEILAALHTCRLLLYDPIWFSLRSFHYVLRPLRSPGSALDSIYFWVNWD